MGLLDRIRALGQQKKDLQQGKVKERAEDALEAQFLRFQQQAAQFLRNCRKGLEEKDRKAVQVWSEKFYQHYHEFTGKRDNYKDLGKEFYNRYADMINALGPIYEAVNEYVNGTKTDTARIIGMIDNNARIVVALRIERKKAA